MDNFQYNRRPANPFGRIVIPLVLYWGISFVCQVIITAAYMMMHGQELIAAYENQEKLQQFMQQAFLFIYRYSTETTAVSALLMMPICVHMMKKDEKERRINGIQEVIWKVPTQVYALIVGFGITAGIAVNNILILSNIRSISLSFQSTSEALYSAPLAVQILCLGIIVPILEEWLYRGVIFRRLRDYGNWKRAMIVSALIFGLAHANLVQFIYGFVFGLALSWIYEKQNTLKAPILLHCTINVVSVLMTATDGYLWIFKTPVRMGVITVVCAALASGAYVLGKNIHKPEA